MEKSQQLMKINKTFGQLALRALENKQNKQQLSYQKMKVYLKNYDRLKETAYFKVYQKPLR